MVHRTFPPATPVPSSPARPREGAPDPAAVFDWVDRRAELRGRAGLTRHLRPRPADDPVLDLAGNDYLGLSATPG